MNRCRPASRFSLLLLTAGWLASGLAVHGQETITTRDNKTQAAHIFGTDRTGVKLQLGAATMSMPFQNILSVSMAPPPTYRAALLAYQSGDLATALRAAKAVVDQYRGLPVDWAQSAMSMLGDIYVDQGQLPAAAAAYDDFKKAYPGAGAARNNVGLARLDVARKNYGAAKLRIDPILAQAMTVRNPSPAASATLGQAYLVSGQVKEAAGDFQGALEDYLRTVTVFPGDQVAVVSAQQHADALRKQHGDVTVP